MKNSFKSFSSMVKFETKRVLRNKVVITMLLLFAVFFVILTSFLTNINYSVQVAVFTNGNNLSDIEYFEIFEKNMTSDEIVEVESVEDGFEMVKKGEASLFVVFTGDDEVEGVDVYYDRTTPASLVIKDNILRQKDQYAYQMISEYLEEYGIKINKEYFDLINVKSIGEVSHSQLPFMSVVGVAISLVLMLGLAYSVAKDNETNIAKNTMYWPIGINKFMLSKLVPYILLGILELAIVLLLGVLLIDLQLEMNYFLIVLLSIPFIISTSTLGLLFNNLKNQISVIFCALLAILIPTFVLSSIMFFGLPTYLQVFLNFVPLTPFVLLINGMVYNGLILWKYFVVLLFQSISFYLISYLITKKKIRS